MHHFRAEHLSPPRHLVSAAPALLSCLSKPPDKRTGFGSREMSEFETYENKGVTTLSSLGASEWVTTADLRDSRAESLR